MVAGAVNSAPFGGLVKLTVGGALGGRTVMVAIAHPASPPAMSYADAWNWYVPAVLVLHSTL
jgi:hypothetical protein